MRKKIEDWLYENWRECLLGLAIGELLTAITIYPFTL